MRGKPVDIHASRCPFVFGRAHEADLCIMDRELSRRHGAILYVANRNAKRQTNNSSSIGKGPAQTPGVFILVDLESTVRCVFVRSFACCFSVVSTTKFLCRFFVWSTPFSLFPVIS
jgi:hypothetical protein